MAEKGKSKKPQNSKLTIKNCFNTSLITNFPEASALEELLRDKLRNIFVNKADIKISWTEIKNEKLPKKLRREKIRRLKDNKIFDILSQGIIRTDLQKFLVVGFNSVYKQLQKDLLSFVIVISTLPNNLVTFLVQLCQDKSVPILGLENLDQVTIKEFGYKANVIGFTSEVSNLDNHFFDISRLVKSVWTKLSATTKLEAITVDEDNKQCNKRLKTDLNSRKRETEIVKNFHLKRKATGERAFVPQKFHKIDSRPDRPSKKKNDSVSDNVYIISKLL